MHNVIVMVTFSVFVQKYSFWANLIQKTKFSVEAEIWYLDQFEYEGIIGQVHFFYIRPEEFFLVQVFSKKIKS